MKSLMIGLGAVLVYLFSIIFYQDFLNAQRQNFKLKMVAEEMAVSASLFYIEEAAAEGLLVFDRYEGIKAADNQLKTLLQLDNNFVPQTDSYWKEKVQYRIYFFDDSNTAYPFLFEENWTGFTYMVTAPTTVVSVDAGTGRYRIGLTATGRHMIRSGAYEHKERRSQ